MPRWYSLYLSLFDRFFAYRQLTKLNCTRLNNQFSPQNPDSYSQTLFNKHPFSSKIIIWHPTIVSLAVNHKTTLSCFCTSQSVNHALTSRPSDHDEALVTDEMINDAGRREVLKLHIEKTYDYASAFSKMWLVRLLVLGREIELRYVYPMLFLLKLKMQVTSRLSYKDVIRWLNNIYSWSQSSSIKAWC